MPSPTPTEAENGSLLEALIQKELNPKELKVYYRYVPDPDKLTEPGTLLAILYVQEEYVSELALSTIKLLEATDAESDDWKSFKWKLAALVNLADVFDSVLFDDTEPKDIFHLWYFYFEGRHSLAESILCGLNGYYSASRALLRVFLEFNLKQLYYYNLSLIHI